MMNAWMARLKRSMKERKRRWIIGASVTLALLVIGLGVFASYSYWRGYTETTTKRADELKQRVDAALQQPATDSATRMAKRDAFEAIVARYATEGRCDVSVWLRWQVFIDSLKQTSEHCLAIERQQNDFLEQLKKVNEYVEVSARLSDPLSGLPIVTEVEQDSIAVVADTWQKTATTIAEMSVSDGANDLKQSLSHSVTSVAEVWREIAAAHAVKDQAKFEAELAKLSPAYAALQTAYDLHQVTLNKLGESLQVSYKVAFQE